MDGIISGFSHGARRAWFEKRLKRDAIRIRRGGLAAKIRQPFCTQSATAAD
jgi:hypothetical protein